jgi:hypothetical protein
MLRSRVTRIPLEHKSLLLSADLQDSGFSSQNPLDFFARDDEFTAMHDIGTEFPPSNDPPLGYEYRWSGN